MENSATPVEVKEPVLIVGEDNPAGHNSIPTPIQNTQPVIVNTQDDRVVNVPGVGRVPRRLDLGKVVVTALALTTPSNYHDVDLFDKEQGPVFDPDRLHRSLHGTQTVSGKPRKDRTKAKLAKKARQKQRKSK